MALIKKQKPKNIQHPFYCFVCVQPETGIRLILFHICIIYNMYFMFCFLNILGQPLIKIMFAVKVTKK